MAVPRVKVAGVAVRVAQARVALPRVKVTVRVPQARVALRHLPIGALQTEMPRPAPAALRRRIEAPRMGTAPRPAKAPRRAMKLPIAASSVRRDKPLLPRRATTLQGANLNARHVRAPMHQPAPRRRGRRPPIVRDGRRCRNPAGLLEPPTATSSLTLPRPPGVQRPLTLPLPPALRQRTRIHDRQNGLDGPPEATRKRPPGVG